MTNTFIPHNHCIALAYCDQGHHKSIYLSPYSFSLSTTDSLPQLDRQGSPARNVTLSSMKMATFLSRLPGHHSSSSLSIKRYFPRDRRTSVRCCQTGGASLRSCSPAKKRLQCGCCAWRPVPRTPTRQRLFSQVRYITFERSQVWLHFHNHANSSSSVLRLKFLAKTKDWNGNYTAPLIRVFSQNMRRGTHMWFSATRHALVVYISYALVALGFPLGCASSDFTNAYSTSFMASPSDCRNQWQ